MDRHADYDAKTNHISFDWSAGKQRFRARWKLIGNNEEFRVLSGRNDKINTQVFDEDAMEVYVPSDVRASLEAKKIDEVILQADVQLYRPEKGQPDPPVITKTEKLTVSHGQDPFDLGR